MKAIESLCGPHTIRTFLEAAVEVRPCFPAGNTGYDAGLGRRRGPVAAAFGFFWR